ncbi:MAG: hypothetical protein HZB39_13560 [Planctomycetes bacterium]|nr:hypothetical protein [Planctomycetota bacterium]
MTRAPVLALAMLGLTACGVAYRPLEFAGTTDDRAFEICLDVLRARFGRLELTDREAFVLQTGWIPIPGDGRVARRRATVFRSATDRFAVVVEESSLVGDVLGAPRWTAPRAQPSLEEELASSIERALGA